MSIEFHLYSSEGCHLCEQALTLCEPFLSNQQLKIIDIVQQEQLVEEYGVHIPVLKRLSDNKKLFWPFNQKQVEELIS